jgi:hypothetical protein
VSPAQTIARAANDRVRQAVAAIADDAATRDWTFFCECGDATCAAVVRLRIAAYDAVIHAGGHVVGDHVRER